MIETDNLDFGAASLCSSPSSRSDHKVRMRFAPPVLSLEMRGALGWEGTCMPAGRQAQSGSMKSAHKWKWQAMKKWTATWSSDSSLHHSASETPSSSYYCLTCLLHAPMIISFSLQCSSKDWVSFYNFAKFIFYNQSSTDSPYLQKVLIILIVYLFSINHSFFFSINLFRFISLFLILSCFLIFKCFCAENWLLRQEMLPLSY